MYNSPLENNYKCAGEQRCFTRSVSHSYEDANILESLLDVYVTNLLVHIGMDSCKFLPLLVYMAGIKGQGDDSNNDVDAYE